MRGTHRHAIGAGRKGRRCAGRLLRVTHDTEYRYAARVESAQHRHACSRSSRRASRCCRSRSTSTRAGIGRDRDRCIRQCARIVCVEPAARCAARAQPQHGTRDATGVVARRAASRRPPSRNRTRNRRWRGRPCATACGSARAALRRGERIRVHVAACHVRSRTRRVCGRELHAATAARAGCVGADAARARRFCEPNSTDITTSALDACGCARVCARISRT